MWRPKETHYIVFFKSSISICGAMIAVLYSHLTLPKKEAINTYYCHFYHYPNSPIKYCDKTLCLYIFVSVNKKIYIFDST